MFPQATSPEVILDFSLFSSPAFNSSESHGVKIHKNPTSSHCSTTNTLVQTTVLQCDFYQNVNQIMTPTCSKRSMLLRKYPNHGLNVRTYFHSLSSQSHPLTLSVNFLHFSHAGSFPCSDLLTAIPSPGISLPQITKMIEANFQISAPLLSYQWPSSLTYSK